jgi:hypothetical protein
MASRARSRWHAQHQNRLVAQEVAAGGRDRQTAMAGKIDADEAQRNQLAQDRAPGAAVVLGPYAKGGNTIVTELDDAVVLNTEQHIDDVGLPEAFAGAVDA